MKKLLKTLIALLLTVALVGCQSKPNQEDQQTQTPETSQTEDVKVISYKEFVEASEQSEVTVETYVQAFESWYDGKITVYTQNKDGAYFLYEMPCLEEDAAKLTQGTKLRVTGVKTSWANEVEIADISKYEILNDDTYIAEERDVTTLVGTDQLKDEMNKLVKFENAEIINQDANNTIFYNWDNSGIENESDIYFKAKVNDTELVFTIRRYLTDETSEVYKVAKELKEGDVVTLSGYLYWYEDAPQARIVSISK